MFLQDDKGNDWYDVIELFDESKTLKIGYDDDGRKNVHDKYSCAFPGQSECCRASATKANLRVTLGDDWFYKDGKLQQIRDHLADAEAKRDSRMAEVTTRIDWLEDAQKTVIFQPMKKPNWQHARLPHCFAPSGSALRQILTGRRCLMWREARLAFTDSWPR
jgi:hypothetical protein